jgi:nucleoredoxin
VSSDQDDESFNEYFGTMPWLAIKFTDEDERFNLGAQFSIRGIPAMIVLRRDGTVVSKDGRADVMKYKSDIIRVWSSKV